MKQISEKTLFLFKTKGVRLQLVELTIDDIDDECGVRTAMCGIEYELRRNRKIIGHSESLDVMRKKFYITSGEIVYQLKI